MRYSQNIIIIIMKELKSMFFYLMARSNFNRLLNSVSREAKNIQKSFSVVNNFVADGNCKEDLF